MTVRRRLAVSMMLVATMTASFGWWLFAPFRASAQEGAAVQINKVQGSVWRPDRGEPLFFALLGSDARVGPPTGGGGRCDGIHIVAINPQTKAGTILNFPRDSYVPVPGLGTTKINAACTRGAETMVAALKNLTGIPIHYYAITEFSNFVKFFDAVGGIDVPVPYAMRDSPSGAFFPAGPVRMTGGQALAFSRNRKDTPRGDFSRTENQGILIQAALSKFRNEDSKDPHRILDYLFAGQRYISTSVAFPELINLALLARDIDPANVKNVNVPGSSGSAGAASVVYLSPGDTFSRVRDDAIF